jgi:CelD/BcsL family acetyltransferase involved in cellulose biosynthesis
MEVDVRTGAGALEEDDWSVAVVADPHGTVFHTPAFLRLWWEHYGEGELVAVRARAGAGGEVVGFCACEVRDGALRFVGGTEVTDYMGPVAAPEVRDDFVRALVGELGRRDDWTRAYLMGLPEDVPVLPLLQEAVTGAAGAEPEVVDNGVAPFVGPLPDGTAYLDSLGSKDRHEIKRKRRRLQRELGDYVVEASTPDRLPDDLEAFIALHKLSSGEKGLFLEAGNEAFFRDLVTTFVAGGLMDDMVLRVGDRVVATALCFRFRDDVLFYNMTFDRDAASASPGIVLVSHVIERSFEGGAHRVDLLKGDYTYKYRVGGRRREMRGLVFPRFTG